MKILNIPSAFEWDGGNIGKNFLKHGVPDSECEEPFFDSGKRIYKDVIHSGQEARFILLGATRQRRLLFIVFTVRKSAVRIISARDLNKKEIKLIL